MKRICGLEYEFGVVGPSSPTERGAILEYLCRDDSFLFHDGRRAHDATGAQVYVDCNHLEWAMPECSDARELVLHDQVMTRRLMQLSSEYGIQLFKNNVDVEGNSFGCHENYLVDDTSLTCETDTFDEEDQVAYVSSRMLPFLVTRMILAGSGDVYEGDYLLSQRAQVLTRVTDWDTQKEKPFFAPRGDENFCEEGLRLHILMGDSTLSEFSTYLKVGTTMMVLDMIEHSFLDPTFHLSGAMTALARVNKSHSSPINCYHGVDANLLPVDIQRMYLNRAEKFYEFYPECVDDTTQDILHHWRFVLDNINHPDGLAQHLDWAIKRKSIDDYRKAGADEQKLLAANLLYHLLDEQGGYFLLRDRVPLARVVSDEEVSEAMSTPPATRARARVAAIKEFKRKRRKIVDIDWDSITHSSPAGKKVGMRSFSDPYSLT